MKAFITLIAVAAATAAYGQRHELPAPTQGGGTTSLPLPTIRIPVSQPTQQVTTDYGQLIATAEYYFGRQEYPAAIAQYEKALEQRQEQYPKDQILRAQALQARKEKDEALQAEADRKMRTERLPQSQFVFQTLAKNDWNNIAIVCDVTGSMGDYDKQMTSWLKQQLAANDTSVTRVVLFNDGDGRDDNTKEIGNAGGLYSFRPVDEEQVMEQVRTASRKGNGGDFPENNIEALLRAQTDVPNCERLILIADNSVPRDISLAPQVTKPVHVILCGSSVVPDVAYVNLARTTKGSLHVNGLSYEGLGDYAEGQQLKIDSNLYVVQGGQFVRVGF